MKKEQFIDSKELIPIGVDPFYLGDEQRMIDLSNAISRYPAYATRTINRNEAKDAYKQIAIWSYELKLRAETEVKLIEEEKR